ncbi:MAG: GDSL-type esterase/lipase family protein [bacterium]
MMYCALILLLLATPVQALPAMEWRFPSFPWRTVFRVTDVAQTNIMLAIDRVGAMPVTRDGFLACDSNGVPLPLRVVQANESGVVLALEAPCKESDSCAVYYGGSLSNEPVTSPEAVADPNPFAIGFMPLKGRAIPSSWERLRYMLKSFPNPIQTPYRITGFDEIRNALIKNDESEPEPTGKKDGRRNKPAVRVALVRSVLLCPQGGAHRFAVDCRDAGFVVVDGELVAAWPGEHESGKWQLGAPVSLKAGAHRLEMFTVFEGWPKLRVGWMPPGSREVVPLTAPDLIAPYEAMRTRVERINRTLQPGFAATPVRAYSFRGNSSVFRVVRFDNITENWIPTKMDSLWRFGDGTQSEEQNPIHVYKSADVFKASLEVRDALGFVAGCSASVDCRQIQPEEYAVSFDMTGLPAVCFGRDKVAPFLRLQGSAPTDVALDVEWEIRLRSGILERGQRKSTPRNQAQFIPLSPMAVGDVETLRWRVSHRQTGLGDELIRFVRAPFAVLPARIEGDRLYDARGARLVLVPDEGVSAFRQATSVPVRRRDWLVCVDDSLAVAGLVETGREPFDRILARLLTGRMEEVRYAALPAWDRFPESYGPLRKLVDVPAALSRERADIAILSIGLQDILAAKDMDSFERQAAALSDVVASSMNLRTVWVTPPPYPSAPERSRAFAAAIRRVAKARGIPVADLFTAFRCADDGRHVFFQDNPLMLSDQGHRLAGQQIVRALMGE